LLLTFTLLVTLVWALTVGGKVGWEELKSKAINQQFFEGQPAFAAGALFFSNQLTTSNWEHHLKQLKFRTTPLHLPLSPKSYWPISSDVCIHISGLSSDLPQNALCSVANISHETTTQDNMILIGAAWTDSHTHPLLFMGNPLKQTQWVSFEFQHLFELYQGTPILFKPVALKEVPYACLQSILSTEDRKFLEHKGIDFKGLARALLTNIIEGRLAQGGSTITQQYIKNAFLSSEKTFTRKVTEARLALWLENELTKDEILERYLNVVYFGNVGPFEIRGIQAASQIYFDLPIGLLDWQHCLVLASVLKGPNQFHPIKKREALEKRYSKLLDSLVEEQILSSEDRAMYQNLPKISLSLNSTEILNSASFLSAVRDIPTDRNSIYLTLVTHLQSAIQNLTSRYLAKFNSDLEASVVVVNRNSGQVLTLINGKDPILSPYPRALKSKRQIGSLIKPYIYYQHFLAHPEDDLDTMIIDEPIEIKVGTKIWSPQNFDKKFYGPVTLNFALSNSLNIPAVKLGQNLNYKNWFPGANHPSLLLGAIEMSPIEVAEMYLKLDQGLTAHLSYVLDLYEPSAIWQMRKQPELTPTEMSARDKVWAILRSSAFNGTSKAIAKSPRLVNRAFGKTGTTSGFRDSWFAGFFEQYLIVVWIGADKNMDTQLTGGSGALPLFIEVAEFLDSRAPH